MQVSPVPTPDSQGLGEVSKQSETADLPVSGVASLVCPVMQIIQYAEVEIIG